MKALLLGYTTTVNAGFCFGFVKCQSQLININIISIWTLETLFFRWMTHDTPAQLGHIGEKSIVLRTTPIKSQQQSARHSPTHYSIRMIRMSAIFQTAVYCYWERSFFIRQQAQLFFN